MGRGGCVVVLVSQLLLGCRTSDPPRESPTSAPPPSASAGEVHGLETTTRPTTPLAVDDAARNGSSLARSADGKVLLLADEDHHVVRRIALPVDANVPVTSMAMPGAPAQIVALADRYLVTVRAPGLLLELVDRGGTLQETARLELPDDAWGIALSADARTALVTSAWTHQITAVDVATMTRRWTANAAREPRGIAISRAGRAYVSHLVGSRVTRIDDVHAATPTISRVEVVPAPLKTPPGRLLDASLGYAALLSPADDRLFLPRHALGAMGIEWWFGQPTVDVVVTADDTGLAPHVRDSGHWADFSTGVHLDVSSRVALSKPDFVQPRAAVYRRSTATILVVSEGNDRVVELDARTLDPSLSTKREYVVGTYDKQEPPHPSLVQTGGAPSAIALSADEKIAWVYCRSTNDLAIVSLDTPGPFPTIRLADDAALSENARKGKRLYYDATDQTVSGGLACSGCHPDGRDDGHVWHEIVVPEDAKPEDPVPVETATGYRGIAVTTARFSSENPGFASTSFGGDTYRGFARQTPMIAGRVSASAPYGWRAESDSLEGRIRVGFALHRWQGARSQPYQVALDRPKWIAAFAREGLVAPKVRERTPTAEEERGKKIFASEKAACTTCHVPATELTNRATMPLSLPQHPGFDAEPNVLFKTPSLLYVGGTPPYYHDGAAASLDDLVRTNGKRMGDTSSLSPEDRAALVAYLRTLGGAVPPFPEEAPPSLPRSPEAASTAPTGRLPPRTSWAGLPNALDAMGCTVQRQGVFVHVTCADNGLVYLVGSRRVLDDWRDKRPDDTEFSTGADHLVFPLQPGDRRVVQVTGTEAFGKWGVVLVPHATLLAHWLPGEAEPTIALH